MNQLLGEYLVIDTKSKHNCAFTAIMLSKRLDEFFKSGDSKDKKVIIKWLENPRARIEASADFKRKSGLNEEYGNMKITLDDLQDIAESLGVNIQVFDGTASLIMDV